MFSNDEYERIDNNNCISNENKFYKELHSSQNVSLLSTDCNLTNYIKTISNKFILDEEFKDIKPDDNLFNKNNENLDDDISSKLIYEINSNEKKDNTIKKKEKRIDVEINIKDDDYIDKIISSIINIDEKEKEKEEKGKDKEEIKPPLFKQIKPELSLFSNVKYELDFFKKNIMVRYNEKRVRKYNSDNIRVKIFTRFLNKFLLKAINNILIIKDFSMTLKKFPQSIVKFNNKSKMIELLDITLKQLIEKKEIYGEEIKNFYNNLKVLELIEKKKNMVIEKIIKMKLKDLFEEYINSDNFKINEIEILKKNEPEDYIERYIYLAGNFLKFYS